jgi:SAM-dependent methyltransferase
MTCRTPHQKYLTLADRAVGLRHRRVLEVWGCSPVDMVVNYAPASWECVNLDTNAVADFNSAAGMVGLNGFSAKLEDIAKLDVGEAYDIAYSINAFEHVRDIRTAFKSIYRSLVPGGHLFTLFGPLWSSDVGHHLSVCADNGAELNFNDGILAPWEHLLSSPAAIRTRLEKTYGTKTAQRAITYIFDYPDLNRLCEQEYLNAIAESGFSTVLVVRNRKGKAPNIPGATNTRELLLVLKKGPPAAVERSVTFLRCAMEILAQHFRPAGA